MTWISTERAMELLAIRERQLYYLLKSGRAKSREVGTAANGRPRREIELESLPHEAQKRFYDCCPLPADGSAEAAAAPLPLGLKDATVCPPPASGAATAKLLSCSEAQLAEVNRRAAALQTILDASDKNKRAAKLKAAEDLGLSISAVEKLRKVYTRHGIAGLVRKDRRDKGRSRVVDNRVSAIIKSEYLKLYRPTAAAVYRKISKDYELSALTPPSYESVRKIIKSIDPDLVALFRFGEREFDGKFAYITQRKKPPLPRQWVDADHHEIDHHVVFPDGKVGRPWITLYQDISTNEVLGFNIPRDKKVGDGRYPGADSIALGLRHAILRKDDPAWPSFGIFEHLYVDLGRDFRSQQIRAACSDLGIKIVHARGYHGKSKPIERFFGIAKDRLRHLAGFCGGNPSENPYRQSLTPQEPDPKDLLSLDDFERELTRWITADFHHAESRALGGHSPLSALEMHKSRGWAARELRDERVLDLLLMRRSNRLVRHSGIQALSSRGDPRFFMAPELLPMIGKRVYIAWDPARIGEILVYEGSRFICKAINRELLDFGASEDTLERERELKREQKRRLLERHEEIIKQAQYPNAMARAAAEERYESVLDKGRQKLAAGAEAEGVPVLVPKYAHAAKRLRAVETGRPTLSTIKDHPWAKTDEGEEDAWSPAVSKCHGCGREENAHGAGFSHCFDCRFREGESCDVCRGSGSHKYCGSCLEGHEHTNPGACEGCKKTVPLYECFAHHMEREEGYCPTCHGLGSHRFCSDCLAEDAHKGHTRMIIQNGRRRIVEPWEIEEERSYEEMFKRPPKPDWLD